MHTKTWSVEIFISEDDDNTNAEAVLHTDSTVLRHRGHARRNPEDRSVPEIGEELATCRALTGLAQDLFEATVGDIEANIGKEASLTG